MKILKQEILHNNYCQQHNHAAVLSLLNHFYFESFSSHIIQVYIFCILFAYIFIKLGIFILFFVIFNSNVFSALHAKHLRYEKKICEVDELIAQHDPSSDVIFLGVHSESIFLVMQYIFSQENSVFFGLLVSCLSLSQSAQILLLNLNLVWSFS